MTRRKGDRATRWQLARRVWAARARDRVGLVAAGVAFFSLLALFPALAALLSVYGLLLDPRQAQAQLAELDAVLPPEAWSLIEDQTTALARQDTALGWGVALGLLGSLWTAGAGVKTLMAALNRVYGVPERRSLLTFSLWGLAFTVGGLLLVLAVLVTVAVLPPLFGLVGLGGWAETLIVWLRWPVLALTVGLALTVLYRYGPCRPTARWRSVVPGAVLAVGAWLGASGLFSLFARSVSQFDAIYGPLAAVIVLLLWFWISSYVVLIGAELNAEREMLSGGHTT